MRVYDERRKVWFDMGHEFYQIRDIADNPSVLYPALSRFVRDTTHARESFLRGRDYLRPRPGPK